MNNRIPICKLATEITFQYGSVINIQQLGHFFGINSRIDKQTVIELKKDGLNVFKAFESNKAPWLVLADDFVAHIMKKAGGDGN